MPSEPQPRESRTNGDSISVAVFVYWILPVLLIATLTRFAIDTGPAVRPQPSKPVTLNFENAAPAQVPTPEPTGRGSSRKPSTPTILADKPTSYQEIVKSISNRRMDWEDDSTDPFNEPEGLKGRHTPTEKTSPQRGRQESTESSEPLTNRPGSAQPRGASSDPVRMELREKIDSLRQEYKGDSTNLYKAINLADSLRMYDLQYHDGGTSQEEAIRTYRDAIQLAVRKKDQATEAGEETKRALTGIVDINEEIMMDYSARSVDGIICSLYTSLGKVFFMANMFEEAVAAYDSALEVEPTYLDALSSRGSSRIILGQYEGAAKDFSTVMRRDNRRRFQDVFTGLARVLQAKEDAVPEGWQPMIDILEEMIPLLEQQASSIVDTQAKLVVSNTLNRFYHVLFLYHDVKTKDTDAAWNSLSKSYHYKMSVLPKWNAGFESQKIAATKQIFHQGFWPADVGSQTRAPVFIIGFVRSGSTLLERVLDAHPQIVGTGENSVFNGQLDEIRNRIVESSMLGDPAHLREKIQFLADGVVDEMRRRWDMVSSGEDSSSGRQQPKRLVDKMLTNYYNVGFIHMLFPNALILHVAREPMDTVFSAYKHEFPQGPLDYTSSFDSLAEIYRGYRDLMDHWDRELPGRVTHIRYEDMVNDMPGVARAIIEATGLQWDDEVLDFHNKKQAVNTLSTTQVRKGVYKNALQAWRKYEHYLMPMSDLLGDRTQYDLQTSLPGYEGLRSLDEDDNQECSVDGSVSGCSAES